METPMKHKSSVLPVDTSEALLLKRRRTEFSGSIIPSQQETEVSDMEPDGLPVEVSAGKDPMDVLTDCAMQCSGEANGRSRGHALNISFTGNEPARLGLSKLCTANGWKEPSFEFEEKGPAHKKLFTCKVTVHLEGLVNTVMECFGDPKPKKKAAQEHAAQGALWCLEHFGHVK